MEGLNAKHLNFIKLYMEMGSGTKAYKIAYDVPEMTDGVAAANATRLLKNVKIASEIERIREESTAKICKNHQISKEVIVEKLLTLMDKCSPQEKNQYLKAVEILSKMMGYNSPDKVEHTGNTPITIIKTVEVSSSPKQNQIDFERNN